MFHDFCSWKVFLFLPGLHPGTAFVRATLTLSHLVYERLNLFFLTIVQQKVLSLKALPLHGGFDSTEQHRVQTLGSLLTHEYS